MSEQVIELSVEETNKLRKELGLAPLRGVPGCKSDNSAHTSAAASTNSPEKNGVSGEEEVLELSVNDTNALREKLGLPRLRQGKKNEDQHAPAPNQGHDAAMKEQDEKLRLKRQVEEEAQKTFASASLADDENSSSLLSWAQQMRRNKNNNTQQQQDPKESNKKKKENQSATYGEGDLKGLSVAHSVQELEGGTTTVLTLADTEILQFDEDSRKVVGVQTDEAPLENINLAEAQKQRDGLREKRQVELGMGRAGGYAGFDDDEFVELGGTQGPSRHERGTAHSKKDGKKKRAAVGFQIGALLEEQEEQEQGLFAAQLGKPISLESSATDHHEGASDFMTTEEDKALKAAKKKKKNDKDGKFKTKSKKDKKKSKKTRTTTEESDGEEEQEDKKVLGAANLLAELEETAAPATQHLPRKRRLSEDDNAGLGMTTLQEDSEEAGKRNKYAAIMQKGNERTILAFQLQRSSVLKGVAVDDEPDDAFLNAALSKARRLNRLKQMAVAQPRGEDAILEAVRSTATTVAPEPSNQDTKPQMVFSIDETREFTRALRAREGQTERSRSKAANTQEAKHIEGAGARARAVKEEEKDAVSLGIDDSAEMSELAKQIKEEEAENQTGGLEGTTGSAVSIGRGLGGVLNILKQTGEITRKNAGREEQRGRARDERTYEDYEPLDLSQVVQIDERTATAKDLELARREVKLEYRDKYGRLLTRKEAFRDLSYQFHGYGSGKRKQEKKLQQIAREQAEQRLSSKQGSQDGGVLGAQKATQKATGKAFIVHKTS